MFFRAVGLPLFERDNIPSTWSKRQAHIGRSKSGLTSMLLSCPIENKAYISALPVAVWSKHGSSLPGRAAVCKSTTGLSYGRLVRRVDRPTGDTSIHDRESTNTVRQTIGAGSETTRGVYYIIMRLENRTNSRVSFPISTTPAELAFFRSHRSIHIVLIFSLMCVASSLCT